MLGGFHLFRKCFFPLPLIGVCSFISWVREIVGGGIRGGRERKKDTLHVVGEIRVERNPYFRR